MEIFVKYSIDAILLIVLITNILDSARKGFFRCILSLVCVVAAIIASAKTEYWMMVGFMIVSIPLLAVLSPGSIDIILYSPIGKFLVGVVAAIVLFTFFRMRKATRTVDFDTK